MTPPGWWEYRSALQKHLPAADNICVFVVDNQTSVVPVTVCSLLPPCQGHLRSSEQHWKVWGVPALCFGRPLSNSRTGNTAGHWKGLCLVVFIWPGSEYLSWFLIMCCRHIYRYSSWGDCIPFFPQYCSVCGAVLLSLLPVCQVWLPHFFI